MVWEPFALAVLFGLLISGGLYFIFIWPRLEPEEPTEEAPPSEPADEEE